MKTPEFVALSFVLAVIASTISGAADAQNAVPMLVNYQGELRSPSTGEPVPDGNYEMLFRIYDAESGGTALWEGVHSSLNGNPVEVTGGIFNVVLGSGPGNSLDTSVFSGSDRWLEIRIGLETLQPRQKITSVAYSITSENSRLLNGKQSSEFAGATHSHSGADLTSGTVSEQRIDAALTRDAEMDAAITAHAAVPDVHHAKTTSFTELSDTATDSQIPAAVARDTEVDTKVSDHAAIPAAHHAKTTSFTELTDTATDGQIPGGITRDSEIVPTVLANDGPGSTLNADLLDGQDSSAFVTLLSDYGRSGVTSDLYEGTTALTDKYVNASGDNVTGGLTVAGSVGIGTTSPAGKLEVTGGTLNLFHDDGVVAGDHELARFERSEMTGYPGVRIGYRADGTGVTGAFVREGGVGGDLEFGTGGFPRAMIIKNSGNVGIGTTSPNAKLHVVTNAGVDSVQLDQGDVITNNAAGSTSRYVVSIGGTWHWGVGKTSTGNNNFHIINYPSSRWDLTVRGDTGNIGVGTTSPQEKLDVNGNARIAGDLTVVGTATFGGVTMGRIYLTGSGTILSTDGGTRLLYWDKTNSEIELTNTSGDWLDYWWQAQKGTTTSGDATSLATGNSNVAIITGIGTTNCYGCEVHFGQADEQEGWCSVWLQYANYKLVGHYIKY